MISSAALPLESIPVTHTENVNDIFY